MTDNKQFKDAVRLYADENNVNYTTARRVLLGETVNHRASVWEQARDASWRTWLEHSAVVRPAPLHVETFHVPQGASLNPFTDTAVRLFKSGEAEFVQIEHEGSQVRVLTSTGDPFPDVAKAPTDSRPGQLPLGVGSGGSDVWIDLAVDPHLLVTGRSGYGKSRMLAGFVESSAEWADVYVADWKAPAGTSFKSAAGQATTLPETIAMTRSIVDELADRTDGPTSVRRPIILIVDEIASLLGDEFTLTERQEDREELSHLIDQIAREGRAADIHLIASTQAPIRALRVGRSLQGNLSRILVGEFFLGEERAVYRRGVPPIYTNDFRRRAVWEPNVGPATMVRCWDVPAV